MTDDGQSGVAWIKLDLLARGVTIDPTVADYSGKHGIACRRNFYNSPVWEGAQLALPQELRLGGLVIGLNSYRSSPWRLFWNRDDDVLQLEHSPSSLRVTPQLIPDLATFQIQPEVSHIANLYGGAAFAFFSPRSCYFFADGTQCGFCSLAGTAAESPEFKGLLAPDDVTAAIAGLEKGDIGRVEQVMIVGGNMRDLDRGFLHHVELAKAAAAALEAHDLPSVSVHIATMPPRDHSLIQALADVKNVHVMFNLEVWDPAAFERICPGKLRDYGRTNMLTALERLRDVIGPFRAHSLLVTGLESPEVTVAGATSLAEMGVSAILNVYHSDRHSVLGLGERPKFQNLALIATELQALYGRFPLQPYWRNCGRNAIDAEASRGLFEQSVPAFLSTEDA